MTNRIRALELRPAARLGHGPAFVLTDQDGAILPGQVAVEWGHDVGARPRFAVTFHVSGYDVRLSDQPALEGVTDGLAEAFRIWAGLSDANKARFMTAHGLTFTAR